MDVRFYPAPPSSVGSCSLQTDPNCLSSLDYYRCNKSRYGAGERGVSVRLPPGASPDGKRLLSAGNYTGQSGGSGGGDEDYEIPPITPPNHPDPSLLHLMDPETGYLCHSLPHNGLINPYSYPELPAIMMSNMLGQEGHLLSGQMHSIQEMARQDGLHFDSAHQSPLINRSPRILAHHMGALSQLSSQIGLRGAPPYGSPSPPGSKSATPSPSGSTQEEETDCHTKMAGEKRPSSEMMKKPKPQKKKKKKDPNEPQKPVSAYALFFRDTQAAIKGQNPNATFGDVSKIVASMWDSLGEEQKQAYKRKTEAAKKEYLKALAAYRASLVSKSYSDPVESKSVQSSQASHMMAPKAALYSVPPQASSPYLGPASFPLSDLQSFAGPQRHALSRTLSQSQMLPSMSASPPSSFQISPPLHRQLSLHQGSILNQPIRMQQVQSQPIISHQMGLQASLHSPPPGQQVGGGPAKGSVALHLLKYIGFPHIQSDYQNSSQSPGASNPGSGQNPDWDGEYCSRECSGNLCSSVIGRDKPLYLT
ncbi:TOX high mobility group box family member 2-like isoform X1 [Anguilla rostrata]|uniref:TOX high mobility group box family member 2-like isoform X1 n=1 Tax=Anguilla anguilla TaxID=7936 RepID=UPI0015B22800|nr:TOX high mobility group box family member 2-like isoform X1 [Anguilla anguilla]